MGDVERPTKVRKTKRADTIAKPDVTIEMAEPVPTKREEKEDTAQNRNRQLNVDALPFEFLTPDQKEEVIRQKEEELHRVLDRKSVV